MGCRSMVSCFVFSFQGLGVGVEGQGFGGCLELEGEERRVRDERLLRVTHRQRRCR